MKAQRADQAAHGMPAVEHHGFCWDVGTPRTVVVARRLACPLILTAERFWLRAGLAGQGLGGVAGSSLAVRHAAPGGEVAAGPRAVLSDAGTACCEG